MVSSTRVMRYIERNPGRGVRDIATKLQADSGETKALIGTLLADGELRKTGQGRGTKYHVRTNGRAKVAPVKAKAPKTLAPASAKDQKIVISKPIFQQASFAIVGTAPYVSNRWTKSAIEEFRASMDGSQPQAKSKKARPPKDFARDYDEAVRVTKDTGWFGIPAEAFRASMVSACSVAGFVMTKAKMSVFVRADGFDAYDGIPLVRIRKGTPRPVESTVTNKSGKPDIRVRPFFDPGWEAVVRLRWDTGQFSQQDVANLLLRAGIQVGAGAGRPLSKGGTGCGWGTWDLR